MQVIYRKYRPGRFANLAGQEPIKQMLTYQLKHEKFGHAYLFVGPRGVGKTTVARIFAKSLNCEKREKHDFEPCGECKSCKDVELNRSLDIIEIDAASHTGVDNVREQIIENSRFAPTGKYKVFIIDEVHMLSKSAFNALLKTLEEPPERVIFILATTEMNKLPETVISRCQRMQFTRIPPEIMKSRLNKVAGEEGKNLSSDALDMIVKMSDGCLRDAESLLGQIINATEEKEIGHKQASFIIPLAASSEAIELIMYTLRGEVENVKRSLEGLVERGVSMSLLRNQLIEITRDILYFKITAKCPDYISADTRTDISPFQESTVFNLLQSMLNSSNLHNSNIPQIGLEIALLKSCINHSQITAEVASRLNDKSSQKKSEKNTVHKDEVINENKNKENRVVKQEVESELDPLSDEISLTTVQHKWQRCCEALKKYSLALPLVASRGKPAEISEKDIIIHFTESFNYETINTQKNLHLLEKAVEEILQKPFKITVKLLENHHDDLTNKLAAEFGGQII
jgi:DNA polymerase-3 subunit gamma/tau